MGKGTWDSGVDYAYMYARIARHMRAAARGTSQCYDAILLVQLRNGARVSEAVRAFFQFLRKKSLEVEVRVSKKKREELRLVIIPEELLSLDLSLCHALLERGERRVVASVKNYCRRTYRVNTHSLRYAFITHLLRQGINPAIIAKITHHSNLDFVLHYTQRKEAERVLRELP